MVRLFANSNQAEHLQDVDAWLKTKGINIEAKFVDKNSDAKSEVDKYGLTILPVLFHVANDVMTKYAEGGEIKLLSDDKIAIIISAIAEAQKLVPTN